MIEIEDVHKSFGALEVLKGVSLTVARGEVVSVIGGSGSGKSTLLMCVNGLEPINSGARSALSFSNGTPFRTSPCLKT